MDKYRRWYDQIIDRARTRELSGYYERHHIVPRALGGSNDKSNLVDLTAREHFLVHWLLIKFCDGKSNKRKMKLAMGYMSVSRNGKRVITGWQYEVARVQVANAMRGNQYAVGSSRVLSEEEKQAISIRNTGRVRHDLAIMNASEQTRLRTSVRSKGNMYSNGKGHTHAGWSHSDKSKEKISLASLGNKHACGNTAFKGKKHSEEARAKMRASSRLRWDRVTQQEATR